VHMGADAPRCATYHVLLPIWLQALGFGVGPVQRLALSLQLVQQSLACTWVVWHMAAAATRPPSPVSLTSRRRGCRRLNLALQLLGDLCTPTANAHEHTGCNETDPPGASTATWTKRDGRGPVPSPLPPPMGTGTHSLSWSSGEYAVAACPISESICFVATLRRHASTATRTSCIRDPPTSLPLPCRPGKTHSTESMQACTSFFLRLKSSSHSGVILRQRGGVGRTSIDTVRVRAGTRQPGRHGRHTPHACTHLFNGSSALAAIAAKPA